MPEFGEGGKPSELITHKTEQELSPEGKKKSEKPKKQYSEKELATKKRQKALRSKGRMFGALLASIVAHLPVADHFIFEGAGAGATFHYAQRVLDKLSHWGRQGSKREIQAKLQAPLEAAAEKHDYFQDKKLGIKKLILRKNRDGKLEIPEGQTSGVDWNHFFLQDQVNYGRMTMQEAEAKEEGFKEEMEGYKKLAQQDKERKNVLRIIHEILNERGDYRKKDSRFDKILLTKKERQAGKKKSGNCYPRENRAMSAVSAVYPDLEMKLQRFKKHTRPIVKIGGIWYALEHTPVPLTEDDLDGTVIAEPTNYLSGYLGTEKQARYIPEKGHSKPGRDWHDPDADDIQIDVLPENVAPTRESGGTTPDFHAGKKITFEEAQKALAKDDFKTSLPRWTDEDLLSRLMFPNSLEVTLIDADEPPKPRQEKDKGYPPVIPLSGADIIDLKVTGTLRFYNPFQKYNYFFGGRRMTKEAQNLTERLAKIHADVQRAKSVRPKAVEFDNVTVDFAQLEDSPIESVQVHDGHVVSFFPLAKAPLRRLSIADTPLPSLEPLKGRPLEDLFFLGYIPASLDFLDDSKTIKSLILRPRTNVKNQIFPEINIPKNTSLKELEIDLSSIDRKPKVNIGGLEGSPVRKLVLSETGLSDFTVLRDLPLQTLYIDGNPIKDIEFTRNMPLRRLSISETNVSDLRPLFGKKLNHLSISHTKVIDLEPLRGMPLKTVDIANTSITDISPLEGAPIEDLYLSDSTVTNLLPLKELIDRRTIAISDYSGAYEIDAMTYQRVPKGTARKVYKSLAEEKRDAESAKWRRDHGFE